MAPKISVIIPVYNVEKYLPQCLDSLLAQTSPDWEAICIDDGSTDGSWNILQQYTEKDSRFKIKKQVNAGQGAARQKAIEMAAGELLGFLDADDWLEPVWAERLCAYQHKTSADVMMFTYKEFDEQKKCLAFPLSADVRLGHTKVENEQSGCYIFRFKEHKQIHWVHYTMWDKAFRREFVQSHKIKMGIGRMGEDIPFVMDAMLSTEKIFYLDEGLYVYRKRPGSSMSAMYDRSAIIDNIQIVESILAKHCLQVELEDSYKEFAAEHACSHYIHLPESAKQLYCDAIESKLMIGCQKYIFDKLIKENDLKLNFLEKIMSIKNTYQNGKKIKVITIAGLRYYI